MAVQETNKTIFEDDSTSDARDKTKRENFPRHSPIDNRKIFFLCFIWTKRNDTKVRKSGLSEFSVLVPVDDLQVLKFGVNFVKVSSALLFCIRIVDWKNVCLDG